MNAETAGCLKQYLFQADAFVAARARRDSFSATRIRSSSVHVASADALGAERKLALAAAALEHAIELSDDQEHVRLDVAHDQFAYFTRRVRETRLASTDGRTIHAGQPGAGVYPFSAASVTSISEFTRLLQVAHVYADAHGAKRL